MGLEENMTKLTWGVVFLAGYWFTPKSLWVLGVAFLIIGTSLVVSVLFDLYRRNLGGPTPQQAFSLVQDVLWEMDDFYDEIEVITNKGIEVRVVSDNSKHHAEILRSIRSNAAGEYERAEKLGLLIQDEYGDYLTPLGLKYRDHGREPGNSRFRLSDLKVWRIENVRCERSTAAGNLTLEYKRTAVAIAIQYTPVLLRTFEWKAERTTDGEWHLAELSEIGGHEGRKPFDLAGLNNWRAMKARWAQEEHDRDRWHDEPDVKDALARYNAEVDPEKKEDLRKEWVEIGNAARIRLGIG